MAEYFRVRLNVLLEGGGGDTTGHKTLPSLTGSSQGMDRGSSSSSGSSNRTDSDRDGIPDSSDNCAHNSYHRCYKEGRDQDNNYTRTTFFF